jgi:hypothetical protein
LLDDSGCKIYDLADYRGVRRENGDQGKLPYWPIHLLRGVLAIAVSRNDAHAIRI